MRPAGAYQIAIKGPLGRDSNLSMKIVPEFKVTGLKELYIPDLGKGPETISFSIQTSLLDGIDSLNGAEQIKVETQKSGIHHISVPAEVNSVGLLLRRETLNHQFVYMPLYFRINRLRWLLVGDNGLVENWLQKHNTYLYRIITRNLATFDVDLREMNDCFRFIVRYQKYYPATQAVRSIYKTVNRFGLTFQD
jgi:hypothetical protein